jgi:hypothetical protein
MPRVMQVVDAPRAVPGFDFSGLLRVECFTKHFLFFDIL